MEIETGVFQRPTAPGKAVLVLGGVRSGKSGFALKLGGALGPRRALVATAQPLDAEMADRIQKHREKRDSSWTVYEEPLQIGRILEKLDAAYDVIVVDCLSVWLSNLMHARMNEISPEGAVDLLLRRVSGMRTPVIFISSEVGLGVIPDNALARRYCDCAGRMHQRVADCSEEVYWMAAGLPMRLK